MVMAGVQCAVERDNLLSERSLVMAVEVTEQGSSGPAQNQSPSPLPFDSSYDPEIGMIETGLEQAVDEPVSE